MGDYSSPTFADIDGDGNLDLVSTGVYTETRRYNWKIFYYKKGDSGYTLQTNPADLSVINDPFALDVKSHSSSSSLRIHHAAFFNADSDSNLELVVAKNGKLHYYNLVTDTQHPAYGHYYGAFQSESYPLNNVTVNSDSTRDAAPVFINLDDDTDLELVVGSSTSGDVGFFKYFDKNDSGTYVELTSTNNPFNGLALPNDPFPAFVDGDGDGDLDLVIGSIEGTLKYYENTDTGYSLDTRTANPFGHIDVGDNAAPAMANMDSDSALELFIGHENGAFYYKQNAQGVYEKKTGNDNTFSAYLSGVNYGADSDGIEDTALAFEDINEDGRMDILIVDGSTANIFHYEQASDGTFSLEWKSRVRRFA